MNPAALQVTRRDIDGIADPVFAVNADAAVVLATSSFLPWTMEALADGAVACMPRSLILANFFAPTCLPEDPQERTQVQKLNLLEIIPTAALIQRLLTCYTNTGVFNPPVDFNNPDGLQCAIRDALREAPFATDLVIHENDFDKAEPFDATSGPAANRPGPPALRFIAFATLGRLVDDSAPLPMEQAARLAGMLGPVCTRTERAQDGSHVAAMADLIQPNLTRWLGGAGRHMLSAATMAMHLKDFLVATTLPAHLQTNKQTATQLVRDAADGFRYHRSKEDKELVESQRILLLAQKTPTLNDHFIALCFSPQEAYACERRLSAALLPNARRTDPLMERLVDLERQLFQRRHLLASMPPEATLAHKIDRLEKEALSVGLTTTLAGVPTSATSGGPADKAGEVEGLRDDAIASAILAAPFAEAENKIDACDLTTANGRRQALDHAFHSGSMIIVRLLARGNRTLARRHPLLAKLHTLRPYLSYYFSYCQAVDINSGIVPPRASKWSWTSPTGDDDTTLSAFLKQQYLAINWVDAPFGFNGLQSLLNQSTIANVDKRDHYTVLRVLEQLSDFGGRTFLAFGVPAELPEHDKGFTWTSFITFFTAHLKRAFQLGSLTEQYEWLAKSDALFRESLRCMGDEVKRSLEAANPATSFFGALLPRDARPVSEMKSMQARLDLLLENRDAFSMFRPLDSSPAQLDVLPRLSLRNQHKRPRSRSTSPVRGGDSDAPSSTMHQAKASAPPMLTRARDAFAKDFAQHANATIDHGDTAERTVPHYHWLEKNKLLFTSGKVWSVDKLAKKLKLSIHAKCWHVVLSRRTPANRQAMCDKRDRAGHQSVKADAHTLGSGVNLGELAKDFARYPTERELKKLQTIHALQTADTITTQQPAPSKRTNRPTPSKITTRSRNDTKRPGKGLPPR